MTERLDPLRLPLHGSRLIEASAGTGKTWTIAAFYVRLVLGHGAEGTAFVRPLGPADILVMTFTRAATRELSDRIRTRLLEAATAFRGELDKHEDPFLQQLAAAYPAGVAREHAAWRLASAGEAMDDAAVQTIDAWCQRMLREHAFDSGNLFDEDLEPNESALLREAALDYWRRQIYPLAGDSLGVALSVWPEATRLIKDVEALLGAGDVPASDARTIDDVLRSARAETHAALLNLKAGWAERAEAMRSWITANRGLFHARRMVPATFNGWLDRLRDWAGDPYKTEIGLSSTALERFTPSGMCDAMTEGNTVALPDEFTAFEALPHKLASLPKDAEALRRHAAAWVAARLAQQKERMGRFGYADLQDRLVRALEGRGAERLRARIVAQFPVAMIDEFQDTSPRQYRIFEQLYRPAANDSATGLFLIGDPKQSIYGFRGADIYCYLRARRATAGRHYMLGTNYRSTNALVAAVNHLFLQAEQRGAGAFLFRTPTDDPVPFAAVEAKGRTEIFETAEGAVPALTIAYDDRVLAAEDGRRHVAGHCAERIVQWLNDPSAQIRHDDGRTERLRPTDVAVLVRDRNEAAAIRKALRDRGLPSIYMSERESVFESEEARDLVVWLRAVAEPGDHRLARAAYATSLAGRSMDELALLADDEGAWDLRLEALRDLRGVWRRQGVLTMIRQLLHRLDLPAIWLARSGGERRLTNVLHLAELLQVASSQHKDEAALVHWMVSQFDERMGDEDDRIVRLESDADLLKVVTVYGSKGLEYPVVCLPFATAYRPISSKEPVTLTDAEGRRRLVMRPNDIDKVEADRDRLREDVRLLYVALTRARHALWVGAIPPDTTRSLKASAFGQTIGAMAPTDAMSALLGAACGVCPQILLEPIEDAASLTVFDAALPLPALEKALLYHGSFDRSWSVGSYSALVRNTVVRPGPTPLAEVTPEAVRDDEPALDGVAVRVEGSAVALPAWHRFPRGAVPGNFLHDQLEWLAGANFDLVTERQRERLLRRCEQQGWGHRQADTLAWLRAVTGTPLPPLGVPLDALALTRAEMEFWLPVGQLEAARIDAICRAHLLIGMDRPALPERQLHGMLMGFADLVFEHGGRYWVLDYKSNALGRTDGDYGSDRLAAEIASHRYDVQGALYLLALHRLLRSRLAGYSPEQHLGGAIFFFLRGIANATAGCHTLPADSTMLKALDEAFSAEAAA